MLYALQLAIWPQAYSLSRCCEAVCNVLVLPRSLRTPPPSISLLLCLPRRLASTRLACLPFTSPSKYKCGINTAEVSYVTEASMPNMLLLY